VYVLFLDEADKKPQGWQDSYKGPVEREVSQPWGLRQEAKMPRKPKVQRTPEEKWQIMLEGPEE
jgi:hypothetical protein